MSSESSDRAHARRRRRPNLVTDLLSFARENSLGSNLHGLVTDAAEEISQLREALRVSLMKNEGLPVDPADIEACEQLLYGRGEVR